MCGVWSEHWQADLPLLQPLKQCWQHSSICFLKPTSAPHAQHKDSTSLIDPWEACSEWNPSWKTSVWPWPLYCNSVPGYYQTTYSLGHLCGRATILILKSSKSSLPTRCHVEHPVVSMRRLYSNNQILTTLKQDTQICMVLLSRKNMDMWLCMVKRCIAVFSWVYLGFFCQLFCQ